MSFFAGASTNTNQSNASNSTSAGSNTSLTQGSNTSSVTPNIPAWYSSFLGSIPGQMSSLAGTLQRNASTPLYGPQQQAAFQNNLNQTQGQASQALQSQLAAQGALNSGRAAQMDTNLALGGQQQLSNYLSQVPLLNAQNANTNNQQLASLIGQMSGFTSPISAFGSTQVGNQSQTGATTAANQVAQTGTQTGVAQQIPNIPGAVVSNILGNLPQLIQALGNLGGGSGLGSILGSIFSGGGGS